MTLVSIFERQLALWALTTSLLGQRPQGGRCCSLSHAERYSSV